MRRLILVLTTVCATLALAGSAPASLVVGANDDAGKIETSSSWVYPTIAAEGLQLNTLTLTWDETDPSTIPALDVVTATVATAEANGIRVEFDLYPVHSQ